MKNDKKISFPMVLALALLSCATGCATAYSRGMTQDERIEARYNQQVVNGKGKRVFFDIITLGICEAWYGKVERSYEAMLERQKNEAEAREAWERYRREHVGKTRDDLVNELGLPDSEAPDGSGGTMLTWENCFRGGGVQLHGNAWSGTVTGVSWRHGSRTDRLWFLLGKDGKVRNVGRRQKSN